MSHYFEEVTQQPETLLRTFESVRVGLGAVEQIANRLQSGDIQRIVFTGMGGSYYAIYPTWIYLAQRDIHAVIVDASELIYYYPNMLDSRTLVVLISQSGRSVEILRVLDMLLENTPTIGITNTPDSPLAQRADVTLFLDAGTERTVSTKTYTSTLVALQLLAAALVQQFTTSFNSDIQQLSEQVTSFLPVWEKQAAALSEQIVERQFLSFLGRGASLASAMTGALITKESAKFPTEGMNCAQFRHGPIEVVDDRIAAVIFAGDAPTQAVNLKLAAQMVSLGAHVIVIGTADQTAQNTYAFHIPEVSPWVRPITEIIPIQLLAGKLAERRGFDMGAFRYIGKVTTEE